MEVHMRCFCPKKNVLRLRVVANSDTPQDQAVKLRVRDAVLPIALQTPDNLCAIETAARKIDPSACARRGFLRFDGFKSDAVQVTLGAGAGHNWWGLLYPSAVGLEEDVSFESWIINLLKGWGWL